MQLKKKSFLEISHKTNNSYFGGGHSRLWDQVLVDTGACDGSFVAISRQNTSSGKPCREGCAGVLLGNLLDYQHFRYHLFTTRRVFCDKNKKKGIKPVICTCNSTCWLIWIWIYPTLQHVEPLHATESQAFQLFQG